MAYYYPVHFWYRGRLMAAELRYDCYQNYAKVIKGKPLKLTERDHQRIEKLIERKPSVARQMESFHRALNEAEGRPFRW